MAVVEQLVIDHLDLWTAAIKRKSAASRGASSKIDLYGIKKLRELILELAIRGLLVSQNLNDEPASELIKKIAAEKAKLMKEGNFKKDKSFPPVGKEERSFELPNGWLWERFGNLAEHNAGKTLDQGRNQGELRNYITTSNLYWGRFDLSAVRQMPIADADLEKCLALQNDLLICEGGEAGRAAVWNNDYPICFQNHIHRARFWQGINPYYAYRLLEKMSYSGEINNYRKGVGISNMSGKALGSIPFPLPPLAEQHRIVAKIDELMAFCDQLEQQTAASLDAHQALVETVLSVLISAADHAQFASAWQRVAGHFDALFTTEESIDQLKQAILQLAVMGKLVPQDPNNEPASELLNRISSEKAKLVKDGKIKKEKPLSPINKKDEPYKVPKGWAWARIGNATLFSEYGISAKTFEMEDGIPVLKMGDIQDGKVLLGGQKKAGRDFEGIDELMLVDGDLLYNRTNSAELVGKTGIFRGPSNFYSFASYLLRIRCSESALTADFLNASMNSTLFRKTQIEPHLKQQCGQANVNGTIMKNMIVPIAPIEEQKRIIAKLEELFGICDSLKNLLNRTQATQLYLADALTEKALART